MIPKTAVPPETANAGLVIFVDCDLVPAGPVLFRHRAFRVDWRRESMSHCRILSGSQRGSFYRDRREGTQLQLDVRIVRQCHHHQPSTIG